VRRQKVTVSAVQQGRDRGKNGVIGIALQHISLKQSKRWAAWKLSAGKDLSLAVGLPTTLAFSAALNPQNDSGHFDGLDTNKRFGRIRVIVSPQG